MYNIYITVKLSQFTLCIYVKFSISKDNIIGMGITDGSQFRVNINFIISAIVQSPI